VYILEDEDFQKGVSQEVIEKDFFKINVGSRKREVCYIWIDQIDLENREVSFIVSRNPRRVTLPIGAQEKIDIDYDGTYDLLLGFDSQGEKTTIFLQETNEDMPTTQALYTIVTRHLLIIIIIICVAVLVIVLIILVVVYVKKPKKKLEKKLGKKPEKKFGKKPEKKFERPKLPIVKEVKPQPKPMVKPVVKPKPKPLVKPVVKPFFKPLPKTMVKPVVKPKPMVKPEVKPTGLDSLIVKAKDFVKKAKQKGYSDEQIKELFRKKRWKEEDINKIFQ
jgi:hypothetical protein